jgi:hypothetical protein
MSVTTGASLEIGFDAPPDVRDALAALGRTEDVRLAPSGRRLAIACFARDRIAVAEVEINVSPSGPAIAVTSLDLVASPALREPHGLDFVDDDTLVVGNRAGGVAMLRLPRSSEAEEMTTTGPVVGEIGHLLDAPGSVAVHSDGPGRYEVLACNNWINTVTRHKLDASGALIDGAVVLRKWLDIPDGIALSHDGRLLAVSNHNTHGVFLYEYSKLDEHADPIGILRGLKYPHGVRFGAGDRCLVVADGGAPHVHVFLASGREWEGVGYPAATITVMDDDTFARGHHNPREGGPKGIDVDPRTNVLVVTSECLPLAFFDLGAALDGGEFHRASDALLRSELDLLAEAKSIKAVATAEASELRAETERIRAECEQLRATAAEAAETSELLAKILRSKSWRMAEPARRASAAARGLRRRIRSRRASTGA